MTAEYVQYGCGLSSPEGWLNFDGSPRLRIERLPITKDIIEASGKTLFPRNVLYGDIVRGLPIPDGCAKAVYCSHVLEHIDRTSLEVALRNTIKILKPGGVFRLVVPDLEWRARQFLGMVEQGDAKANDWFMLAAHLGEKHSLVGFKRRLTAAFGNSQHRWMWHEGSMSRILIEAGFASVRRCEFGDAHDPMFSLVEEEGRFKVSGNRELAMEAVRPE